MLTRNTVASALAAVLTFGTPVGAVRVTQTTPPQPATPSAEDPIPPSIPDDGWEQQLIILLTFICEVINCNASNRVGDGANAAAVEVCLSYYTNGVSADLTQEQILNGIADAQTTLVHLTRDPGVLSVGIHHDLNAVLQQIKADLDAR